MTVYEAIRYMCVFGAGITIHSSFAIISLSKREDYYLCFVFVIVILSSLFLAAL